MPLQPEDQAVLESLWTSEGRRIHEGRLQKLCRGCNEWKHLDELARSNHVKTGTSARCRPCDNVREKLRRVRNEQEDEARLAKALAPFKRAGAR
jgi:hypothetical protein